MAGSIGKSGWVHQVEHVEAGDGSVGEHLFGTGRSKIQSQSSQLKGSQVEDGGDVKDCSLVQLWRAAAERMLTYVDWCSDSAVSQVPRFCVVFLIHILSLSLFEGTQSCGSHSGREEKNSNVFGLRQSCVRVLFFFSFSKSPFLICW